MVLNGRFPPNPSPLNTDNPTEGEAESWGVKWDGWQQKNRVLWINSEKKNHMNSQRVKQQAVLLACMCLHRNCSIRWMYRKCLMTSSVADWHLQWLCSSFSQSPLCLAAPPIRLAWLLACQVLLANECSAYSQCTAAMSRRHGSLAVISFCSYTLSVSPSTEFPWPWE